MAFKNLEQRFNERASVLYAGSTLKFNNGKASSGVNDDPLIVRRPGAGYWNAAESRSTPISSALQDVKRLSLFTASTRGVAFLAKQQLLQSGNTFAITRLLNPAFVVANAVPFLHVKRNFRPLNALTSKTDTSTENVNKLGRLQSETLNDKTNMWHNRAVPSYISKHLNDLKPKPEEKKPLPTTTVRPSILNRVRSAAVNIVKTKLNSPVRAQVKRIQSAVSATASVPTGSRPEINTISERVNEANKLWADRTYLSLNNVNVERKNKVDFIKYFTTTQLKSIDPGVPVQPPTAGSNLRDPLNSARVSNIPSQTRLLSAYKSLHTDESVKTDLEKVVGGPVDPIVVSFAMGKDAPVQFRAFVKEIQQSIQSGPKEYQYIGRIEKFISYGTVQRRVNFRLDILAFSKEELSIVWKRINYMTGLLFPHGINRGILQPNIVRMTIGNLYTDQPGYIVSMNTKFNEISDSWDIDQKVPIGASIDVEFIIIEKRTALADTPFYGITENDPDFSKTTQDQIRSNLQRQVVTAVQSALRLPRI